MFTAAKEIEDAGGKALALVTDIRFEDLRLRRPWQRPSPTFGGIDILVNNASAMA